MKVLIEAQIVDGQVSPVHVVETYCPNCGRDVDQEELDLKKCNDCGFNLSDPTQNVSIYVTTLPSAGGKVR